MVSKEFVSGLIVGEGHFGLNIIQVPRLKTANGFKIMPRFALHMNDERTMDLVIEAFKEWELPVWVEPPRKPNGKRISMAGIKRTTRIAETFLPWLTGTKHEAASLMLEFNHLRLSKPQNSPYGEDEVRIVNRLREVNGGNFKHKRMLESSETARRTRKSGTLLKLRDDTVRSHDESVS